MATSKQLLLKVDTNTNQFVNLNCKKFTNLYISNSDSEDITIHLVVGKDDNAGQTSITNGAYILRGVTIPMGVTMHFPGINFSQLRGADAISGGQAALTGALREDDYTLLVAAGDTNKLYTIFLEY
jgi:hypothetical protein